MQHKDKKLTLYGAIAAFLLIAIFTIDGDRMKGRASYYSDKFHGKPTASGEPYDRTELTAAHPELEFGTEVRVTYLETGESVVVEVNDRGPHSGNRIIDLSRAAAREIGLVDDGVGLVELEVIN
ncbi:septal ring lytic transglycosylase RlpA family protein [Pelagicoccus sp. NFK12]|uniref:Probable endolytic peptidoglycan transglycosylase RlpA n=1 Tax=Pelagicoccus enzymogenes TaxID=2773457 RepID=A0A927FDB7_9BACT|nr:septal ring lytic transglycosylase RlpA family protein [Pelagicoccus enzymogenes]MBD5782314.1 septal ring lytic transglycosylase RlpA family protein [Pelagicoccus enzymogenes]MDQ8199229.1 septal ring lytic transglycosylase RlpA family protein [Pelagicoccus enzymogenes]